MMVMMMMMILELDCAPAGLATPHICFMESGYVAVTWAAGHTIKQQTLWPLVGK
jgi:hypothetical protein